MAQMTTEVCKLSRRLSLSVEGQEALASPSFPTSGARFTRAFNRLAGGGDRKAHRGTGLGQSEDRFLVGSPQAQFGEVTRCPLIRWSFTRKPLPNMTRRLIGTWNRARMPRSAFDAEWIGHWHTSCKLLNDGQPAHFPRAGFCSVFPFIVIYRQLPSAHIQIVAIAHASRRRGYWMGRV